MMMIYIYVAKMLHKNSLLIVKQPLHNLIPKWDFLAIFLYINIELVNK